MTARLRLVPEGPAGEAAGDASTPAATSGGGRAARPRDTRAGAPGVPGLSSREQKALQELVDSADAVVWGLSMRLAAIVWRVKEATAPTTLEIDLLQKRVLRLQESLDRCKVFVADRATERT